MVSGRALPGGRGPLAGRRILLVEDEYLIVADMVRTFEACGAEIVGPAASVDGALDILERSEHLDGAVLDINLQGEMAFRVADALSARGVPFVFASGYDGTAIPARYGGVRRCEKPVDPARIAQALFS